MNKLKEYFLAYCRYLADPHEDGCDKLFSFFFFAFILFVSIILVIVSKGFVILIAALGWLIYTTLKVIGKFYKEDEGDNE